MNKPFLKYALSNPKGKAHGD